MTTSSCTAFHAHCRGERDTEEGKPKAMTIFLLSALQYTTILLKAAWETIDFYRNRSLDDAPSNCMRRGRSVIYASTFGWFQTPFVLYRNIRSPIVDPSVARVESWLFDTWGVTATFRVEAESRTSLEVRDVSQSFSVNSWTNKATTSSPRRSHSFLLVTA